MMNRSAAIQLSGKMIPEKFSKPGSSKVYFKSIDNGDVFSLIKKHKKASCRVQGCIYRTKDVKNLKPELFGDKNDKIRIIITELASAKFNKSNPISIKGYIKTNSIWHQTPVTIFPRRQEIFSRSQGLIETSILSKKTVGCFGVGSIGAVVLIELFKAGIGNGIAMDHDRLEVGNITRHPAGLSDVDRYKVLALRDIILNINPYANIKGVIEKVDWSTIDKVRKIIKASDIIICATDTRESKIIINRICVEEDTICIFVGGFRRVHGGQALIVRPAKTLCYQCFCMQLPEMANDIAVSRNIANRIAYSDRPVAVEPGLNNDIAPLSTMAVKLSIQELLKGNHTTTLRSLDDDLVASWFLWLNRRQKGTPYEKLKPLGYDINGLKILRWYGIDIKREPYCPVCGDHSC